MRRNWRLQGFPYRILNRTSFFPNIKKGSYKTDSIPNFISDDLDMPYTQAYVNLHCNSLQTF
jgi:hypothetical protein